MPSAASADRGPLWIAQLPLKEDGTSEIRRLMIANRGEIACRIIATCRKLQISTIAIYVDEDSTSQHISEADEAIPLGSVSQPGGNPFLNIELLVETAVRAGAHAIHPGYGFISENAHFADAVRAAGIIFVGPSSEAMSTLGDKRQAKDYLSKNEPNVPLIPGFNGSSKGIQLSDLEEQSAKIGFPVMIKASAGGGGRGMRIVHKKSNLKAEFERAQSEAQRSFGLSDCILEKYIEAGKHVEVQIIGDRHGKVIALYERECSVQRRHQKVVEESPCAWLSEERRINMCNAAVKVGELLGYEGAGTVEFIVDISTGSFYFLEVNARLQVEHPITEECTGLDIVALQLFVASGGSLATISKLDNVTQKGHAIECRLCAEDPNRDFAPQHGLLRLWAPWEQQNVRFEAAFGSGGRVSIHFDSMIAKIVVWAPNRAMAIEKMAKVLANTACAGITTNQLFLQACVLHPKFRQIDYSTSFIPSNIDDLLRDPYPVRTEPLQNLLTLVPALFMRTLKNSTGHGKPNDLFGSMQRGFRNQRFDRVNVLSDIITTYYPAKGIDASPWVLRWSRPSIENPDYLEIRMAPLPLLGESSEDDSSEANASAIVTKAYNKLSASLRTGPLSESVPLRVKIHDLQTRDIAQSATSAWKTGTVDISINDKRLLAYVSTGDMQASPRDADMGDSTRVYCHFPAFGRHFEFRCYSILSFFEGKRLAESGGKGASQGPIRADMPCKVLRILKKEGDKVKSGEVLMVVESMKMEITVSAAKDGVFESSLKEGDAVDEGVVMCNIK